MRINKDNIQNNRTAGEGVLAKFRSLMNTVVFWSRHWNFGRKSKV
jgi:hypothetical protein